MENNKGYRINSYEIMDKGNMLFLKIKKGKEEIWILQKIMKQKIDYCSSIQICLWNYSKKLRNYVGSITEQVRKKKRKEARF